MRWQRIVFSVTVTEGLSTEVSEKRKECGRKRSLSLATDKIERILKMLESQSKAIYDKK